MLTNGKRMHTQMNNLTNFKQCVIDSKEGTERARIC